MIKGFFNCLRRDLVLLSHHLLSEPDDVILKANLDVCTAIKGLKLILPC